MSAPPLSIVGLEITRLFGEVDALDRQVGDTKHREWPRALFAAESDRFALWAVNMGLFVPGHGSLDYRTRDSASLKSTFARFMTDLRDSLDQVHQYCSGAFDDHASLESPYDSDNPDDSDDWTLRVSAPVQPPTGTDSTYALGGEADSDIDLLVDSVRDPIDRLYKLSTRIRNPSTRFASSKAQGYQKVDPESKLDFLKEAEPFDRDYVSSLFLQYHKANALRDAPIAKSSPSSPNHNPESSLDDAVWEPIRSVLSIYRGGLSNGTESFLVDRLARANTRRRRQFAYWTHHKEKLLLHTHSVAQQARAPTTLALEMPGLQAVGGLGPVQVPAASVTTATCLQLVQLAIRDDQSAVSQSEYAPSSHPGVDAADFPVPPKRKENEKYFECPYCFTLCPAGSLKAWRAHLIRDLRPYVCTYKACRNPDQLYDTREDWIQHETTSHFAAWRCLEHDSRSFSSAEAYQTHLAACHGVGGHAGPSPSASKAGELSFVPPDRRCPICNFSLTAASELHKHIALHLERIALFSLPHVGGDDDDDGSEVSSQSVNLPGDGGGSPQGSSEALHGKVAAIDSAESSSSQGTGVMADLEREIVDIERDTNMVQEAVDATPPGHFTCRDCPQATSFKTKGALETHVKRQHTRPFICVFAFAGCESTFASKNEWKRHVMSQHVLLKFWCCTQEDCANIVNAPPVLVATPSSGLAPASSLTAGSSVAGDKPISDPRLPNGAIFSRKDLYNQHFRQMHAPDIQGKLPLSWVMLVRSIEQRAEMERCQLPTRMLCPAPGCTSFFEGSNAWDERMEHLAKHLEAATCGDEPAVRLAGGAGAEPDHSLIEWASRPDVAIIVPYATSSGTEMQWVLNNPLRPSRVAPTATAATNVSNNTVLDHLDALTSMEDIPSTYRNQGRYEEAEKLDVEVMEFVKLSSGPAVPPQPMSMEAMLEEERREVLALLEKSYAPAPPPAPLAGLVSMLDSDCEGPAGSTADHHRGGGARPEGLRRTN